MKNLKDEENPKFLFSTTDKNILTDIVNGRIDLIKLASIELKNRGLNHKGEWVGH